MKVGRRTFLIAFSAIAIVPHASAQTGATRTQIDLALAAASLAAMLTRYGEGHVDVVAARSRITSLSQSLREARARHETIDAALVTSSLEAELADTRARLGESATHCGPSHPEMESGLARETALESALQHVRSDGFFVP